MHRLGKKIHVYDDIPGVEMYRRSIYHGPSKPTMFRGFYGLKKKLVFSWPKPSLFMGFWGLMVVYTILILFYLPSGWFPPLEVSN